MIGGTTTGSGSSSPDKLSELIGTPRADPVFDHDICLFCNKLSESFDDNMKHMQKVHGLFIPYKKRLIVDLETLFSYLHLIIVRHNECICCGTQRASTLAVQQHMVGKGHCKFDIASDDSEFADFYDFSGSEAGSGVDEDADDSALPRKDIVENRTVQPDENSLRLPSGRVISHRSQIQINPRRQLLKPRSPGRSDLIKDGPASDINSSAPTTSLSTSLVSRFGKDALAQTRADKKEYKFAKQLASLNKNDERSLAHLPLPQQRAILATHQKQIEKAHRAEEKYRGRLESLGNQFLMTHFVKDAADKRTLWK
ncbi:TRI15 [Verticillium alfalfae VaMs.102]|uniref:TRI15 n=1 Tax=Verticillium alfalfae (strain VaMs.102 / ATCC MYA-4576 / FGSC 10136) TaxID=526221 RepID=C9SY63_VERA1|nr:TRI15 [Verticillium alfalfae VaMs.102]EEY23728.1 TRI15 [Verticillium alfalfae VaMs.102]